MKNGSLKFIVIVLKTLFKGGDIMYDFSKISVKHGPSIELIVRNNSKYKMIDKGAHGAVFKLPDNKCVKIYADKINCELESRVYKAAQKSTIVPRLYEVGENYIVIEFIDGLSLQEYLVDKGRVSTNIAKQLLFILDEMKRLGFTRQDSSLRHIIVNKNKELKVIDLVYAYTRNDPIPIKLFRELDEIGLIHNFLEKVAKIDYQRFLILKSQMEEYLSKRGEIQ